MDLAEGFDIDPAEEHDHASDREDGSCQKLYVKLVFHIFFWIILGHFGLISEIRCKGTTKKRSHQILWLRLLTIDNFTAWRTRKSPTIPPKATIRLSIFGSSTLCCADDGAYMYPPIRHKWF